MNGEPRFSREVGSEASRESLNDRISNKEKTILESLRGLARQRGAMIFLLTSLMAEAMSGAARAEEGQETHENDVEEAEEREDRYRLLEEAREARRAEIEAEREHRIAEREAENVRRSEEHKEKEIRWRSEGAERIAGVTAQIEDLKTPEIKVGKFAPAYRWDSGLLREASKRAPSADMPPLDARVSLDASMRNLKDSMRKKTAELNSPAGPQRPMSAREEAVGTGDTEGLADVVKGKPFIVSYVTGILTLNGESGRELIAHDAFQIHTTTENTQPTPLLGKTVTFGEQYRIENFYENGPKKFMAVGRGNSRDQAMRIALTEAAKQAGAWNRSLRNKPLAVVPRVEGESLLMRGACLVESLMVISEKTVDTNKDDMSEYEIRIEGLGNMVRIEKPNDWQ